MMTDATLIVRVRHIRQAGYCASGTRAWFERHGLNYMEFLKNGLPAEAILARDDHLGNEVVRMARIERDNEQLKEACDG
jgi:hypothetical protein